MFGMIPGVGINLHDDNNHKSGQRRSAQGDANSLELDGADKRQAGNKKDRLMSRLGKCAGQETGDDGNPCQRSLRIKH